MAMHLKTQALWLAIIGCLLLVRCTTQSDSATDSTSGPETIRFLALGDSYTIGESVDVDQRWPVQLAEALRQRGYAVDEPTLIARTGWTTSELLSAIETQNPSGTFDLVSLLIGVNNQYRGASLEAYRLEFRELLALATAFAGGDAGRVIVLSIPDWGVTPFAEGRDREQIATEIDRFNAWYRGGTPAAGARDGAVTAPSRGATQDPALIAADGLHPSGEMYAAWVRAVLPEALAILKD